MQQYFTLAFITSYLFVIIPTTLVIITALLSAKHTSGTLGQGIKKIAAGSIMHTILIATYITLENGNGGLLEDRTITSFFLFTGSVGSLFLITGYYQIYQIARRLKLFTV